MELIIKAIKQNQLRRYLDIVALLILASISVLIAAGRGLKVDRAVSQWIEEMGNGRPWLDGLMFGFTWLGNTSTIMIVTAVFAVVLTWLTRHHRAPVTMITTQLIAWGGNNLLKLAFARARPQFSALILDPPSYSYPSGHAMISTAVYGCAALLLSEALPRFKWYFRITAALLVFCIGLSRIYLDAHWPSDVLAGFAGGWITISLVRRVFPPQSAPR